MVDYIRPTPRNALIGDIADGLTDVRNATGAVGNFLIGQAPETLNNLSYGVPPVQFGGTGNGLMGAINGMQVDPGVADVAGLLGMAPGVARSAGFVGREALRAVDDGMMGSGALAGPLQSVAPKFMLNGVYKDPKFGPRVPVNVVPDTTVRLAKLQVENNSPVLRLNPIFLTDKSFVRYNLLSGALDDFKWPFGDDVYIRNSTPQDYNYLTSGTHRGSINHATGEDEGGLSVTRSLAYPADRSYLVSGERLGDGSDGEPLLRTDSVRAITKPMSSTAMAQRVMKARLQKYKDMGLTNDDVSALGQHNIDLNWPQGAH